MKLILVCVLELFWRGDRHLNLFESKQKKKKKETNGTAWKITVV